MPKIHGKDKGGCWVKWGKSGKKYHYKCGSKQPKKTAEKRADKQASAIYASGYKGK